MKSFGQIISEQLPNDKLDKLTHNIPLSKKRLKKLAGDYSAFEDFDFDSWQSYPFPSNSSKIVIHEIQYLIGLQEFRNQWKKDIVIADKKVIQAFGEYLDKHELEVDLDRIEKLRKQSSPILLSLKRFYNRPRPNVLAKKLGLDFTFIPLKTAETPSYPSGHATQGRLVAKLVADEVPFKHRADIIRIGEDLGEGRMIAGVHYPTDTNFGHLLADELYRLAKDPKKPELTLETLEEGLLKKLTRTFNKIKGWINRAFSKLKRMGPGQETIITIPGIKQEYFDMSDTKSKITLNEGALQAIKGNYNEALVLQYIYQWTGNGVKIASKYLKEKAKIDNIVRNWDNQLRNKISNWRDAKKIIVQGSSDMTKYLVGTTLKNDAIIIGAYLDNLSYQGGAEFKADIQVAIMKEGKEILQGYSLKLYSGKSVGLANTSPKRLAGHLAGPAAEKEVETKIANDRELQQLITTAKEAAKQRKLAKKAGDQAAYDKWFKIRHEARTPINPRLAKIAYDVIKPYAKTPEFGENLLKLIGFTDKDTKMLMAVTTAKKSLIIDAHPDLDVTNIDLQLVGVSIKVVGPKGKTIVSFGVKEGERKAISGKVSFADIEPVDLASLPMGQN